MRAQCGAGETVGVDYTLASSDPASSRLTLGEVAAQYGFCAGTSGFSVDLELDEADRRVTAFERELESQFFARDREVLQVDHQGRWIECTECGVKLRCI